jgi:hypothetical protein
MSPASQLSGHTNAPELQQFLKLTRAQQVSAIRELAMSGMSEYGIAAAVRLSVEQVRLILADTGAPS